jgi:hypothetical protein
LEHDGTGGWTLRSQGVLFILDHNSEVVWTQILDSNALQTECLNSGKIHDQENASSQTIFASANDQRRSLLQLQGEGPRFSELPKKTEEESPSDVAENRALPYILPSPRRNLFLLIFFFLYSSPIPNEDMAY